MDPRRLKRPGYTETKFASIWVTQAQLPIGEDRCASDPTIVAALPRYG